MQSFNLAEAVRKIPEALEDLIVRGAYLDHSARELERSRHEQTMRLEAVRASQPPFLFLRPKETRAAFKSVARDTTSDLTVIDQALEVNKRLCDHLRALSEHKLATWLSTDCEEYRAGLEARHFAGDWEQSLQRATEHANTFVLALGNARNLASAGYDQVRGLFSAGTYDALHVAHAAAIKVEAEITAANGIARQRDRFLGETVFNDPMPRLVEEPYAAVVAQIAGMSAMAAQVEFCRVISAVEDLIFRELEMMRSRMREATAQHEARLQSYVRSAWNQLHAHAVAHSVDPVHVSTVVAQTERAYLGAIEPALATTTA